MKKILILCFSFALTIQFTFSQKKWNQLTSVGGNERYVAISFALNDKVYVGLGENKSAQRLYDMWEFDPVKASWTQKSNYPGGGSYAPTSFTIGGKAYVCLGANTSGTLQKDLWEYDPNSDKWTQKTNFPGTARYGASAFVIGDTAFVGTGTNDGTPYFSDMWMYIPKTNTWTQRASFPGGARSHSIGFSINGYGYMGSGLKTSTSASKDFWKYNHTNNSWTQISDLPGPNIMRVVSFVIGNVAYVGTGSDLSKKRNEIYSYDDAKNTWTAIDSIPSSFTPRHAAVAAVVNNIAYIGTGHTNNAVKDFWEYTNCKVNILEHPKNQKAKVGEKVKFGVQVSDKSISFQWQVYNGSSYVNLSNKDQYSGVTTDSLLISNITKLNQDEKYRCVLSHTSCSDTTKFAQLDVQCIPLLKSGPSNKSVYVNSNVSFKVSSLEPNAKYRWQSDIGFGFQNINNAGQYDGVTTDSLTVTNAGLSNQNQVFRCIVNYQGCFDTSVNAVLKVDCKKLLASNPISQTVYTNTSPMFSLVRADFSASMQWQIKSGNSFLNLSNSSQYSGVTDDTLKIKSISINDNGNKYRCVLQSSGCFDTSEIVELKVLCKPILGSGPKDVNAFIGSKAVFKVTSLEPKAKIIWQSDIGFGFQNLSNVGQYNGVTLDSLLVSNLGFSNQNQSFRCLLQNDGCTDTSRAAILKVFCNPMIGVGPKSVSGYEGSRAIFRVTSLEANANYIWQSDVGFGYQNLSNVGQYQGVNLDSLIVSNLSFSNQNQSFRCILEYNGCRDTTNNALLNVQCNPIIKGQPIDKNAALLGETYFSVTSNDPTAGYAWQSDIGFGFQNISNAGQFKGVNTDTLRIINLSVSNDQQIFRCILKKTNCADTSQIVKLSVRPANVKHVNIIPGLTIYPNPVKDELRIRFKGSNLKTSISLYTIKGELVYQKQGVSKKLDIAMDNFSQGLYYLNIISEQGSETIKIIKE